MKAILSNGRIVTGRLAEIFVSRNVAKEISEEVQEIEANESDVEVKKEVAVVKKKAGRPKAKK